MLSDALFRKTYTCLENAHHVVHELIVDWCNVKIGVCECPVCACILRFVWYSLESLKERIEFFSVVEEYSFEFAGDWISKD